MVVPTDVADPADAVEGLGGLDVAANNAAGGHGPMPLAEVRPEQFGSALAISLEGIFLSLRYELPAMLRRVAGRSSTWPPPPAWRRSAASPATCRPGKLSSG